MVSPADPESAPSLYAPILGSPPPRSIVRPLAIAISVAFLLVAGLAALFLLDEPGTGSGPGPGPRFTLSRKRDPTKDELAGSGSDEGDKWTPEMLSWQRTAFHFQPPRNFMSDPSGPLYYKGWYHFFYQHNARAAFWGNIAWGHAASRDLLNWVHLPLAVAPDHWYDFYGDWTGSVVALPDGRVIMLFTGGVGKKNELAQVVNLAVAADPSDPLLIKWNKYDANPVLAAPNGIGLNDFRDPNPIWYNTSDSTWHVVVGSKNDSIAHTGIAFVYTTKDFISYNLLPGVLHAVDKVGMWECVDLFPVASEGPSTGRALDNQVPPGKGVKHVLKVGLNDEWHDYYAIGTYDREANTWTPDDKVNDVGIGLRLAWGRFYASRTFYDPVKQRRVLWGYVQEADPMEVDVQRGWASVEGMARTILYDVKTGSNLLIWPIEEVESLRMSSTNFSNIAMNPGSTIPLIVGNADQLDIEAEFEINKDVLNDAIEPDDSYVCGTSGGAATRGLLGPFGLLVLANSDLTEQTATYFYVSKGHDGRLHTHLCQDELRSSKAKNLIKEVVGYTVPVLDDELLSLRILVDHSIVESFAQGGRTSAISRVYPTEAIYTGARVFLFNNATGATVIARSVKIWQMNSTHDTLYHYP